MSKLYIFSGEIISEYFRQESGKAELKKLLEKLIIGRKTLAFMVDNVNIFLLELMSLNIHISSLHVTGWKDSAPGRGGLKAALKKIMREAKIPPDQTIFYSENHDDFAVAKKLGIKFVLVGELVGEEIVDYNVVSDLSRV